MADQSRRVIPVLQVVGIVAPTLYTGFTFAYTHVLIPPLTNHAPQKLLAKQWLEAYRFAPTFVAPLVMLGTSSNALLAYLFFSFPPPSPSLPSPPSLSSTAAKFYVLAALATATIAPYTALYMEPGVNGAGKWKARELLGEQEVGLKGVGRGTERDSATKEAKEWAEGVDMKVIVERWARLNGWRYVITAAAVVFSAGATVVGRW